MKKLNKKERYLLKKELAKVDAVLIHNRELAIKDKRIARGHVKPTAKAKGNRMSALGGCWL